MVASMFLFCLMFVMITNVAGRTLCMTGSDLYQKLTVDCSAQDPTYQGQWYCATIHVCESYISPNRQCMQTKGCAKEEQCLIDGTSNAVFTGDSLHRTIDGVTSFPAGMEIKPECCKNPVDFADDDGALDYEKICNGAGKSVTFSAALIIGVTVLASLYAQL